VLDELEAAGWSGQLVPQQGAAVRCVNCDAISDARHLVVQVERRLEGASDPDDLSIVVATNCPVCGTPATIVLGYGPAASEQDSDIVGAMARSS
jgi:hypothetical protein